MVFKGHKNEAPVTLMAVPITNNQTYFGKSINPLLKHHPDNCNIFREDYAIKRIAGYWRRRIGGIKSAIVPSGTINTAKINHTPNVAFPSAALITSHVRYEKIATISKLNTAIMVRAIG